MRRPKTKRPCHNLALVGFMGTGKSTLGRMVAGLLGAKFIDTDDVIESKTGLTISQIFAQAGEPAFRQLEHETAQDLTQERNAVIATGGGFITNPANLQLLRQHAFIVCLWAPAELIHERVKSQVHRPLLKEPDPLARIRRLLAERSPAYAQADLILGTGQRSLRELADHVVRRYHAVREEPPSPIP